MKEMLVQAHGTWGLFVSLNCRIFPNLLTANVCLTFPGGKQEKQGYAAQRKLLSMLLKFVLHLTWLKWRAEYSLRAACY